MRLTPRIPGQIAPKELIDMVGDPESPHSQRATEAMLTMKKIDLAA